MKVSCFWPRGAGNVARIANAAKLYGCILNAKFEDNIPEESNRCHRVFTRKHQLTWFSYGNLISQFCVWNFIPKQAESNVAWKTDLYVAYIIYKLSFCEVNWNCWFRRFKVGFFLGSTSNFYPLEKIGFWVPLRNVIHITEILFRPKIERKKFW